MLNIIDRRIWIAIGASALLAASVLPALAATEDTVSATVTPQIIAVSVEDGDVDYGTLDISESNNTFNGASPALGDKQTITNDSNVSVDIALRSSDAFVVADTTDWELAGAIGSNAFVHSYDINAVTPVWTAFPFDSTFANTNASAVVTLPTFGNTATLDLKLDMPNSISNILVHNVTVTVIATET